MYKKIINFAIIAHIDHGKSTISDRIIEKFSSIQMRDMSARILDSMDLEKERGITIKSQTVRLEYKNKNGENYILNLMDTPGHVDFGYEVSRCLAACDCSILVVDASQGVEAQTVANTYKAIEADNEIILALNKIDLPAADVEGTKKQIEESLGLDTEEAICVSGKTGDGIEELVEFMISKINLKTKIDDDQKRLKAFLIDAWYDEYLGVIMLLKIVEGTIRIDQKIKMLSNEIECVVEKLGVFAPKKKSVDVLSAGEVGFISPNLKDPSVCLVGDTIVDFDNKNSQPFKGFKKNKPNVFCGIYTIDKSDYPALKEAFLKLQLNDSSIEFSNEKSSSLGIGVRCGFLGLLHMEIVIERIRREFDIDIITTAPSVLYKVEKTDGSIIDVSNAGDLPEPSNIRHIEEPIAKVSVFTQDEYLGAVIDMCIKKRGIQKSMNYISSNRVSLEYELPLSEIVLNFHDNLKSISKGYASFEWFILNYRKADIVKVDILIAKELATGLSFMTHRDKAEQRGRALLLKLKDEIPKHMFTVALQASIGSKVAARETISAMRKDVTAKCYGGDISRKKKLLEKQKKGKKKMAMFGSVEVPQQAFLAILKTNND